MAEPDSGHVCLSLRISFPPEPCDGCYVWHPYAVCFVCFVISLPVLGLSVGISDYDYECNPQEELGGFGLAEWLISYCVSLLCYEIYFFSDIPSYWSNLYARVCKDGVRMAFYYISTLALFLWWCTGWYIYSVSNECQSTQLGGISLIVLLVSMIEAMVVGCFCLVTFMVRSYIRADHPSNRHDRDTDPLLHRSPGWIGVGELQEFEGDAGTQSSVGMRARFAAIISEKETIEQLQQQHSKDVQAHQLAHRTMRSSLHARNMSIASLHSASADTDSIFRENPPPPDRTFDPIAIGAVADPISITPAEPFPNAADADFLPDGGI